MVYFFRAGLPVSIHILSFIFKTICANNIPWELKVGRYKTQPKRRNKTWEGEEIKYIHFSKWVWNIQNGLYLIFGGARCSKTTGQDSYIVLVLQRSKTIMKAVFMKAINQTPTIKRKPEQNPRILFGEILSMKKHHL